MALNLRFVNYNIDKTGNYVNKSNIHTRNFIAVINTSNPQKWEICDYFELKYDISKDNLYIGLEDIRLYSHNNQLYYNANRGIGSRQMMVENGEIDLSQQTAISRFIKKKGQNQIEKNWVLINSTTVIYKWFPLTIGVIPSFDNSNIMNGIHPDAEFCQTHEMETPAFFKDVRGSTNAVRVGDELWFIAHLVSYEDRRYYYHLFIALDERTFALKKYTKLWTFEKSAVEYTLGFQLLGESVADNPLFLIGYSLMDKETKFMTIDKNYIENMMILVYTSEDLKWDAL